jgi:hypothetical protein
MTDQDKPSAASDQEPLVERRPYHSDPTAVDHTRTSDASTVNNGGLGGGRPQGGATITPERARYEERAGHERDVQGGDDVPRRERANAGPDDPVMPADDASVNTKI